MVAYHQYRHAAAIQRSIERRRRELVVERAGAEEPNRSISHQSGEAFLRSASSIEDYRVFESSGAVKFRVQYQAVQGN